jgi:hypothetical protein
VLVLSEMGTLLNLSEFLGPGAPIHVHTVHFYEQDEKLLAELATYLETALRRNCSAIVIATRGHL